MNGLKQDILLIFQGVKILQKLSPYNLTAKILRSLCDAALPFANLYLSAMIIDALVSGNSLVSLMYLVALTLGINLLLILVSKLMDTVNYVKWSQFYLRYNMTIGEKALSLEYEKIEDSQTHITMKNIDDAMKISNYGLIKLHSRIPLLTENIFGLCFSMWLILSVVLQKGTHPESFLQIFANSIYADILLAVSILSVTVTCIFANTKISLKTYSILGAFSKLNRVFDYYLSQYLDGYKAGKDIRLYRQDVLIDDEIRQFGEKSGKIVNKLNAVIFNKNILIFVTNFILVVVTYLYVGLKSIAGAFAVGSILKYSGGILQFSAAFSGAMDAFSQLRANNKYLKDYLDFMNLSSDMHHGTLPVEKRDDNEYEIEFRNVSFKYPGSDIYALKNLNLKLNIGQRMAVVGMNGSGKTTMIKLLCRLYDPTEGEITLNRIDIRKYNYSEYMNLFSVVFQDFRLFSFSLGQNVAAKVDYDSKKAVEALNKAGLSERLAGMPKGIDTPLYKDFEEDGVEISGGEAQKIALARALYKDAPFIVLDEPTAALDPIAEFEIYSKFNEIVRNKTVVYISHRLSSCRFCDDIAVFHEGELIQRGNHNRLIADVYGKYHELWNAQAQYYNGSVG